jgi:hypothetical protein
MEDVSMKVTSNEKPFEPVELTITIESEKELNALYVFTNVSLSQTRQICDNSSTFCKSTPEYVDAIVGQIWSQINKIAKAKGIK